MRPFTLAASALALGFLACRPDPQPAPAPRPAEDGKLRPLTSRDEPSRAGAPAPPGAQQHESADPHGPAGSLPPGHPPIEGAPAAGAPIGQADAGGSVAGSVDAAPAVKGRIRGGALFLIARNAKTRQIVAVRKAEGLAMPQKFSLSGADAMTPGTPFEGPLDITARWSQNGDAMPAPGDIEGVAKGVAVGTTDVKVVLSETRQ